MGEHTPTPWRVRDDFGGGWIQGSPLMGETYGDRVCNLAKPKRIGIANAAFIVKAVNSHDELVAALKGAAVVANTAGSLLKAQDEKIAVLVKALEECRSRLKMDLDEIQHLRGWLSDSELSERADQDELADQMDKLTIFAADEALAKAST